MRYSIPLVFVGLLFAACTNVGGIDAPTYQSRMRGVEMGMTKAEFLRQFPEANARGAKAYPQGTVEVLEVMQGTYQFMASRRPDVVRDALSGMEYAPTWFYFYNGKLTQYGLPNDWPKDPDKIIEVRVR